MHKTKSDLEKQKGWVSKICVCESESETDKLSIRESENDWDRWQVDTPKKRERDTAYP